MTAQTATYGMDYLNHAQPKDVLVWIRMNTDILPNVGSKISKLFNHKGTLTIPCHQFAASVIGRCNNVNEAYHSWDLVKFNEQFKTLSYYKKIPELNGWLTLHTYLKSINPFHGMTMPDGSPRTSCTREEFEAWSKELDA